VGLTANEVDIQVMYELVEGIQTIVINYQVSNVIQNGIYGPPIIQGNRSRPRTDNRPLSLLSIRLRALERNQDKVEL